jgi:hypothetical protein
MASSFHSYFMNNMLSNGLGPMLSNPFYYPSYPTIFKKLNSIRFRNYRKMLNGIQLRISVWIPFHGQLLYYFLCVIPNFYHYASKFFIYEMETNDSFLGWEVLGDLIGIMLL